MHTYIYSHILIINCNVTLAKQCENLQFYIRLNSKNNFVFSNTIKISSELQICNSKKPRIQTKPYTNQNIHAYIHTYIYIYIYYYYYYYYHVHPKFKFIKPKKKKNDPKPITQTTLQYLEIKCTKKNI